MYLEGLDYLNYGLTGKIMLRSLCHSMRVTKPPGRGSIRGHYGIMATQPTYLGHIRFMRHARPTLCLWPVCRFVGARPRSSYYDLPCGFNAWLPLLFYIACQLAILRLFRHNNIWLNGLSLGAGMYFSTTNT
mgnify:CR=1 FL=1